MTAPFSEVVIVFGNTVFAKEFVIASLSEQEIKTNKKLASKMNDFFVIK